MKTCLFSQTQLSFCVCECVWERVCVWECVMAKCSKQVGQASKKLSNVVIVFRENGLWDEVPAVCVDTLEEKRDGCRFLLDLPDKMAAICVFHLCVSTPSTKALVSRRHHCETYITWKINIISGDSPGCLFVRVCRPCFNWAAEFGTTHTSDSLLLWNTWSLLHTHRRASGLTRSHHY